MQRKPIKKFTITINQTKEEIQPPKESSTTKNSIDDVIKYRRTINRFKSPLSSEELIQFQQFIEKYQFHLQQSNQSKQLSDIQIELLSSDKIKELYQLQNQPKFNVLLLSSKSQSIQQKRLCIDIMNKIEFHLNTQMIFGYSDKSLSTKLSSSSQLFYAFCFGHPLQKFIRYAPRSSPQFSLLHESW